MKNNQVSIETKILLSIAEASAVSGLSRSMLYAFIASGELKTVTQGRRRMVTRKELVRFCAQSHASVARVARED